MCVQYCRNVVTLILHGNVCAILRQYCTAMCAEYCSNIERQYVRIVTRQCVRNITGLLHEPVVSAERSLCSDKLQICLLYSNGFVTSFDIPIPLKPCRACSRVDGLIIPGALALRIANRVKLERV